MMKRITYCLIAVIFASCSSRPAINHHKINELADRTCRAIDFRKQRFSLANEIRFAQDTMRQTKSKADYDRLNKRLEVLSKEKSVLLKESLALADTIRLQLDSIMPYTDKEAQKKFTAELNALLEKRGCKD